MQRRKKKKSGAEAHGLKKPQVLRGLIDVEDGSVAVDLTNLGAQHVFTLTGLCFHLPFSKFLNTTEPHYKTVTLQYNNYWIYFLSDLCKSTKDQP